MSSPRRGCGAPLAAADVWATDLRGQAASHPRVIDVMMDQGRPMRHGPGPTDAAAPVDAANGALAEGVGFEPTLRFPVNTLSKRAPSATRPPLRTAFAI